MSDGPSIKRIDAAMGACGWDVNDPQGAAECLLADLRHWCIAHYVSFDEAVRVSKGMYEVDLMNARRKALPPEVQHGE